MSNFLPGVWIRTDLGSVRSELLGDKDLLLSVLLLEPIESLDPGPGIQGIPEARGEDTVGSPADVMNMMES